MSLPVLITVGLCLGLSGTLIGCFLAMPCKTNTRLLSFTLEFSAGLMISIVCFDLVPHAYDTSSLTEVIISMTAGIVFSMLIQEYLKYGTNKKSRMSATGKTLMFSLIARDLPEGLAIGSGFGISFSLGLSLSLAMLVHNVPEGFAITLPMKAGGMAKSKIILCCIMAGLPIGIGMLIGIKLGNISPHIISIFLSFAGGVILYTAIGDLIPESKRIYVGRRSGICNVLGVLCGVLISRL